MKRCPTCDKTFDDAMRFCQSDGTPLVPDEPLDPYKTMIGGPENASAPAPPPIPVQSPAGRDEDDVLEIPAESASRKTTFTTEEEIRREMAAHDAGEGQVIEIPPLAGTESSEPPKFGEPSLSPPPFGDVSAPPPSPFSSSEPEGEKTYYSGERSPYSSSNPPIPSPFGEPKPAPSDFPAPSTPPFAEREPLQNASPVNPFDLPLEQQTGGPMAQAEWTPPPAPQSGWQEPGMGSSPLPPPPAAGGVNQTLPIVSLVLGIISICCYISPITGIAALITGFKGMKNANDDPAHYGGKGLAIAGMITGGIFFLLGVLYWLYIIFVVGLAALGSMGGLG